MKCIVNQQKTAIPGKLSIVSSIFISLLLLSCNSKTEKEVNTENEAIAVNTIIAKKQAYQHELSYAGTIKPFKEANLGTSLPGRVEKIYYPKGAYVQKGNLLVKLSGELATQAMIEYETIKKDFERVSRLHEKGSVTQQDYDHTKAKLEASEAKYQLLLKNSEIRAPFSGVVVEYLVQEGENFLFSPSLEAGYSHTSGILKLAQLHPLIVEIDVNEKDILKIAEGMSCTVYPNAAPDKIFEGKIKYINPLLSTRSRTATVEIHIENKEMLLKPGMFAQVTIPLAADTAVAVPLTALYKDAGSGGEYVFSVVNNIAYKKPVERISIKEDMVFVKGIKEGEIIVSHGKNKLFNESKVNIIE